MTGVSQDLIDECRHINVDTCEWHETVVSDFTAEMEAIGIYVEDINYSISFSQGDGACFYGMVDDWEKFLPSIGITNPTLLQHAKQSWGWRVSHRGHYTNSASVHYDAELPSPDDDIGDSAHFIAVYSPYADGDLRSHAWYAVLNTIDYNLVERDIKEAFVNHMDDLYYRLLKEYEYQTSDEAVTETIIANGWHLQEHSDDTRGAKNCSASTA